MTTGSSAPACASRVTPPSEEEMGQKNWKNGISLSLFLFFAGSPDTLLFCFCFLLRSSTHSGGCSPTSYIPSPLCLRLNTRFMQTHNKKPPKKETIRPAPNGDLFTITSYGCGAKMLSVRREQEGRECNGAQPLPSCPAGEKVCALFLLGAAHGFIPFTDEKQKYSLFPSHPPPLFSHSRSIDPRDNKRETSHCSSLAGSLQPECSEQR